MSSLVELLKGIGKFAIVASVAVAMLMLYRHQIVALKFSALEPALADAMTIIGWSILAVSASMILIALVDVPYQIYDHTKKLRMTQQEIRQEHKDTEGKPEVKGKVRQLQREMANRRMMEAVPEADVVITNPEHFAVALKYNPEQGGAPQLVAKGTEHLALRIREVARRHDVLILEVPPLARAIYFTTELDEEIPANLYLAVAQVLAYVFQLKAHREGSGQRPRMLGDVEVPPEARYDSDGYLAPEQAR